MKILSIPNYNETSKKPNFGATLQVTPELYKYFLALKQQGGWREEQIKDEFKALDKQVDKDLVITIDEFSNNGDTYCVSGMVTNGKLPPYRISHECKSVKNALHPILTQIRTANEHFDLSRKSMSKVLNNVFGTINSAVQYGDEDAIMEPFKAARG